MIEEPPHNVAAIAGSDVTMSCEANSSKSVAWFRKNDRINKGNNITSEFQRYNFSILNEDLLAQKLQIKAVRLEHAGVFKCAAGGEDNFAELVVLGELHHTFFTVIGKMVTMRETRGRGPRIRDY